MEKKIKDILDVANQHFVEKFAKGDFTILHQSNSNSKIECDGEIFWLWHDNGADGLVSNLDNPIKLNFPEDVQKKVFEKLTGMTEAETIQTEIKIMENRLEGLKRKLKEISK